MKTQIVAFTCLTLLALACQPDPLPELREQSIGRWDLSISGYVDYPYGANTDYSIWISDYELELMEDSTFTIRTDTIFRGNWRHKSRDFVIMDIPESFILPHLGKMEIEFTKNQNRQDYQYWIGSSSYESDTASVDAIGVYLYLDMYRIP